jgi:hypothetical protein
MAILFGASGTAGWAVHRASWSIAMSISPEFVIEKLKRVAKRLRKESPSLTQAKALDQVASLLGYLNWSLLNKHVGKMSWLELSNFHDSLYQRPNMESKLPPQYSSVDSDDAIAEMKVWVEGKFTRLVEFAYHDSESENGYAWDDEDLDNALQEEFAHKYPYELIQKAAVELEMDGPWGIEAYGDDED